MIGRIACLCLVEGVVIVLLAMRVYGAGEVVVPQGLQPVREESPGDRPPAAARASLPRSADLPVAKPEPAVAPARSAVVAKWRPDDPVGVLLTGSVRRRDGTPADASASLLRGKERKGFSVEKDGTFAVVGLQPGAWDVALRGDGIVERTETITLGDDAVQHHDFVVDASFAVKVLIVTADGADGTRALRTALPGWGDFQVAGQRGPFPDRLAPTDYGAVFLGDARWKSEMNPSDGFAGTLFLTGLPGHAALLQRHLVLEQQVVQPGQSEVRFVVDVEALERLAATATLRVLDADTGAALTSARVELNTSNRMGGAAPKIDDSGRVTLPGLSPGLLGLTITAKDHESVWATVSVEAGKENDLGEYRVGKAMPLNGTLLDAEGKPATANLTWTELKWRSAPRGFRTNRTTRVEADGTFSLWGTGQGRIAVQARTQDGLVAAGVFDNPPAEPLVLRLCRAATCVVTRPDDPTRAFTVTLFDTRKLAIEARTLESRTRTTTISLPPGSYAFEVHDDAGRLVQSGSLTFGETPSALEIR